MNRLKKGDTVEVIAGKDRGRRGKILQVFPEDLRVLVEGVNVSKRHMRPTQTFRGGIVDKPIPLHSSKLMPVCPHCNKPTRVYATASQGTERRRECGECGKVIDSK